MWFPVQVLQQLAPDFEKSSGHHLVIEYATAGKVKEKVAADEANRCRDADQAARRKASALCQVVGGTATVLARVPIGLAVRKGAPQNSSPVYHGTNGSNPSPSSGESANFRFLQTAASWARRVEM